MHIGGACSKRSARGDEPSGFGHGVTPETVAPGNVVVVAESAGGGAGEVVEVLDAGDAPSPPELHDASNSVSASAAVRMRRARDIVTGLMPLPTTRLRCG
jgi:hypothetical protein